MVHLPLIGENRLVPPPLLGALGSAVESNKHRYLPSIQTRNIRLLASAENQNRVRDFAAILSHRIFYTYCVDLIINK